MSVTVRRLAATVLALVGLVGGAAVADAASPTVVFADAHLKACVLQALGSAGPEVGVAELKTLTSLSCEEKAIGSVDGLGGATSLKSLDLIRNELTDLGGLAGLSELQSLDVSYNRVQGISVLRGLSRLQAVSASYNSIGTLGDLSMLNDLDRLDLDHNSVTAASSFAGGAVLRDVDLSFNLLADASFASRLKQVKALNLSYNRLTSAIPFGGLQAEVDVRNQLVQLPSIVVDTVETLPVVRATNLDAIPVGLIAESQAYGYQAPGGFTWRSNGIGQLGWAQSVTLPAGNTVSFSGRFTQAVTRGTLTAPAPTISGTAAFGTTLTAVPGAWGPAPVTLKYQWRRSGADITGATAATYAPVAADVGAPLSVAVTGSKTSYATVTTTSASTAPVAPLALTASPVPTVSGSTVVGQTLTAAAGTWAPAPVSLAYQWYRGGTAIGGATAPTYKLVNADAGATITVTVTGAKPGYATATKTSAATALVTGGVIVPGVPAIKGTAAVGSTLTVALGYWSPVPVTFAYQWKRNGAAIAGATHSQYAVVAADLNTRVSVTVTASRSGYTTASKDTASVLIGSKPK